MSMPVNKTERKTWVCIGRKRKQSKDNVNSTGATWLQLVREQRWYSWCSPSSKQSENFGSCLSLKWSHSSYAEVVQVERSSLYLEEDVILNGHTIPLWKNAPNFIWIVTPRSRTLWRSISYDQQWNSSCKDLSRMLHRPSSRGNGFFHESALRIW